LISPLTSADDFARQLSPEELAAQADSLAARNRVVICSAQVDGLERARAELGDVRASALLREVTLLVRRILRGTDAVTLLDDELVLLLDQTAPSAETVAERLLSAVRGHLFTSAGVDQTRRLTLTIGVATAPEHGTSYQVLILAARQARSVAGADSCARAFAANGRSLAVFRFVGRSEPLSLLSDELEHTVRGAGRVVAVVGERGVGKSALLRMLIPEVRLRGGSLVVAASREPMFVSPYAVWSEVLRGVRRLPVKSTRLWRELHALDPTLERAGDGGVSGGSKTHLLEELADFLRLAAQQRPLVLVLENLQWADAASWDALEYLIAQMESERILFAVTLQTGGEDDAQERWERMAVRSRSEIRLTHLTRDDVKRWLEVALHVAEVGRDLLAFVYRHTEGNPLALTHLVHDLEESGHLVYDDGAWQSSPVRELPVPVSLDDLLARRIARLPPASRLMLEAAALLVREAEEALLLDVSGVGAIEARAALDLLLERGMLIPTYDRGRAAFAISHDELARIARARIAVPQRADLHGRLARALSAGDRRSSAEIAGHYERAGRRNEAYRHALRASEHALAVYETVAAAELLAAAERNAPSDDALADVRVRMAALAEAAGQYEQVESLCEQVLSWYEAQHDSVQVLRLQRMRVRVRMQRGEPARDTLAALLQLETQAREVQADAERAAILLQISHVHWRLGDLRAAQRVAAECVEIAQRGTDLLLIADSSNRLAVTIQLENAHRARELFDVSLEIATSAADAVRRVRALNNIGVLELISNNWDEAKKMLTLAAEQARTARLLEWWGRAELNLGVLAGRMGDTEGSARALSEALRLTSMVQNSEEQLYATYNMAHLERERLRFKEAADTYELVTDLAERIGQVEVQAGALAGLGLCRFLMGDIAGAREPAARAAPMMERLLEWFQGRELVEALNIHLLLTDNRIREAAELFSRALTAAGPSDVYGGAWLTAEFGAAFRSELPGEIEAAVQEYARRPEVLGNSRMRERLDVLKVDS